MGKIVIIGGGEIGNFVTLPFDKRIVELTKKKHPKGTLRVAIAARQAVEATLRGISLDKYSKEHIELKDDLKKWEEKRK